MAYAPSNKPRWAVGPPKVYKPTRMKGPRKPRGKKVLTRNDIAASIAAYAASKGKEAAMKYLEKLKVEGTFSIGGGDKIMTTPTPNDDMFSSKGNVISGVHSGVSHTSGKNLTYTANCYKVKFTGGQRTAKAVKAIGRLNGEAKVRVLDTRYDYIDTPNRLNFEQPWGFNRRKILFIDPVMFGFSSEDIGSYFNLASTLNDSKTSTNTSYAAIQKLISKMKITSNNSYLPMKATIKLVKQLDMSKQFSSIMGDCTSLGYAVGSQEEGALPVLRQLTSVNPIGGGTSTAFGNTVELDRNHNGLYTCGNYKSAIETVWSYTQTLYTGDSLEFIYEHECGSGIHLEQINANDQEVSGTDGKANITYGLIIELEGVFVEAVLDAGGRINGTSFGSCNFEFDKRILGSRPSLGVTAATSTDGFVSRDFAVRTFAETPKAQNYALRIFNTSASGLGLDIPVMSDKFQSDAQPKI